MREIESIAVGIPARDEEGRIGACLRALLDSAGGVDVPVSIVVVADACTDATAQVAREVFAEQVDHRVRGTVMGGELRSAGAARSLAIDAALTGLSLDATWIATTDADTVVHPTWLSCHLDWARRGADGVAGLVAVHWEGEDDRLPARYAESLVPKGTGPGHQHVHGANLGLRADRWRAVGGCGPGALGEDSELWDRLQRADAVLLGVDDLLVETSGRLEGRAPGGFGSYLTRLTGAEVAR